MERSRKRRRIERNFCHHCKQELTLKTYKTHKRRFYDTNTNTWLLKERLSESVQRDLSPQLQSQSPTQDESLLLKELSTTFETVDGNHHFDLPLPPGHELHSPLEEDEPIKVEGESIDDDDCNDEVEVWVTDGDDDPVPPPLNSTNLLQSTTSYSKTATSLVKWIMIFVFFLRFKYSISNAVTTVILKFFKTLFTILGRFNELCKKIADVFPGTLHLVRTAEQGLQVNHILRYVVCPQCYSIYQQEKCTNERPGDRQLISKLCSFRRFPMHRQTRMRQQCGAKLMRSVETPSGNRFLYPYLSYCYLSLKQSIRNLLQRDQFVRECEQWRSTFHSSTNTLIGDVFDGEIWREFQCYQGKPFLSESLSFGLMLNADWFEPYKHNKYSVGAMYMVVMNLPRAVRYKRENVILCGLIPGPKEPSNINPFLRPLVEELLELWDGVEMVVEGHNKIVRCAILCIACDIPAGRKLCGLPWYTSHYACSRCKKYFPGTIGNMDYSGFSDRQVWPKRKVSDHRNVATQIRKASTMKEVEVIESQSGYRYSALLNLPYIDISRMLVVDPMHNLFQGTAKRVMKHIWICRQLITDSDLEIIQSQITDSVTPPDIGRIPLKIRSGFADLTADELKNWVIYFSVFCLKVFLSPEHMECWRLFVRTCRILCQKKLSLSEVKQADALLVEFCQQVERLYGKSDITPNMHMHTHLCECIVDYGPLHSFWLFSFERYNGILGKLPTNNHSIEHQFIKRFLEDNEFLSLSNPEEFREEFSSLLPQHKIRGSVAETINPSTIHQFSGYLDRNSIILPNHYTKALFHPEEVEELTRLYSIIHSVPISSVHLSQVFKKYTHIMMHNKSIGSHNSRSQSTSIVVAYWNDELFGYRSEERPVRINYFADHNVTIEGNVENYLVFSASWFMKHPNKDFFGEPVTVWDFNNFELCGRHSIIPVQLISSRTVSLIHRLHEESVLLIVPCVDF